MDATMKSEWESAINSLMALEPEKRKHFALLLVSLVKCYTQSDDWKAVILINNKDSLLTFSAGATEFECAEMLQLANDAVLLAATEGAPEKGMMN